MRSRPNPANPLAAAILAAINRPQPARFDVMWCRYLLMSEPMRDVELWPLGDYR